MARELTAVAGGRAGRSRVRAGRHVGGGTGSSVLPVLIAVAAVAWGVAMAVRRAWVADDAFISFRYAEHLTRGLGLVYNAGERVEGYSNFLWTLWAALGLELGVDVERWAHAWSIACYAACIGLLAWRWAALRRAAPAAAPAFPAAAVLAAVHPHWNDYATSGLETSLFTLLVLIGFVLLAPVGGARGSGLRLAVAGAVLGLAALTRPDGVVFAGFAGLFVVARLRAWRPAACYAAGFAALWVPFTIWRVAYYGDFFPNPWYAKSIGTPWYGQGLAYAGLYALRYWPLVVGALAALVLAIVRRRDDAMHEDNDDPRRARDGMALAALFACGHTLSVVHIGGDFMFARMLIPATPFFLILGEHALARLTPRRPPVQAATLAAAVAAFLLTPTPVSGNDWVKGIGDERGYYQQGLADRVRANGETLRGWFDGLPVRIVALGGEARLAYYSKVAVAIEGETGLTDRWIARQPLQERGRVGHEKRAPAEYLIGRRGAHFAFHPTALERLELRELVPALDIRFGDVYGLILRWDPELLAALRSRGAEFIDFPQALDQFIAVMDSLPDDEVRRDYWMNRRFYFNFVRDPQREAPFLARLNRRPAAPTAPPTAP